MTSANIGRLAFRVEGESWVAYFAATGTMDGAIWMGAIRMSLVNDPERKRAFMDIMKGALSDFLESQGREVESWNEEQAPEHEKAGRA
jgi:hypothetical protein